MSLVGRLSEMSLPEILQAVSITEKTGKITITTGLEEGVVVVRNGKVIYAASTGTREAFGNVLVCLGLIDMDVLHKALERQHHSRRETRLGTILVEMGELDQATLEKVMLRQTRKVLADLFQWTEGFFSFRPMDIPDRGEVEVDCRDLLLDEGLNPETLARDLVQRFEAMQHDAREYRANALGQSFEIVAGAPEPVLVPEAGVGAGATPGDGHVATLGTILRGVDTPALTAETVQRIARCVCREAARGLLFRTASDGAQGVAAFFAAEDGEVVDRPSDFWLPASEPSIVSQALGAGEIVRGPLEATPWNAALAAELGGVWPQDAVAIATAVRGSSGLVIYADSGERDALGAVEEIHAVLRDAALSMARARKTADGTATR